MEGSATPGAADEGGEENLVVGLRETLAEVEPALAKDLIERHSASGGIFVKLAADGDKVVGAFVGDFLAREVHWTGERNEDCSGDKGCEHCGDEHFGW